MIVAGLAGPPCVNCFQVRRRVKGPGADGDPVSGEPRLPEKRGAALLAEGISRIRHWVEPPQFAIIILDLKVSGIGSCGGHVMACEAAAPVAMAVEDVPEVSEDLEGDPTAKAPPRSPGCRVHVRAPPCSRLSFSAPGQVIARRKPDRPVMRKAPPPHTGTFQPTPDPGPRPDHLADPRRTDPILGGVSPHATWPYPRAGLLRRSRRRTPAYVPISDSANAHARPRLSADTCALPQISAGYKL